MTTQRKKDFKLTVIADQRRMVGKNARTQLRVRLVYAPQTDVYLVSRWWPYRRIWKFSDSARAAEKFKEIFNAAWPTWVEPPKLLPTREESIRREEQVAEDVTIKEGGLE